MLKSGTAKKGVIVHSEIYYFSGTGNSYSVAKKTAQMLDAKLIPIASVINEKTIKPAGDIIGIIFPVYYVENDCVPLIVQRFAKKLVNIKNKYIFSVCTFGGGSYKAFDNLNKILISCDGKLSAGFGIQMPQNVFKTIFNNNKLVASTDQKINKIVNKVKKKKVNNFNDFRNVLVKIFMSFILKKERKNALTVMQNLSKKSSESITELILSSDNSYTVGDNCNGCGICAKVCPVKNIHIVNNKPVWKNHCETCIACFNWCPRFAIHGGLVSTKEDKNYHYHHPEVTIKDIIV